MEILEFVYIVSLLVEVRSCVEVVIDCVWDVVKRLWLSVDVEVCSGGDDVMVMRGRE